MPSWGDGADSGGLNNRVSEVLLLFTISNFIGLLPYDYLYEYFSMTEDVD